MTTINERIAKVKDIDFDGKYGITRTLEGPLRLPIDRCYDWQHSIADAWGLVEEMMARGEALSVATSTPPATPRKR